MGRRYYCDYCDKTFIDDIEARKKHLNSALHQKLMKEHYQQCRDPKTLLSEEIVKLPCRRFMQTGSCQFLGNCKYTHYTQEELWEFKKEVEYLEALQKQNLDIETPSVESWLEKYNQQKSTEIKDNKITRIWWHYPDILELRTDLPISLIKFKPEHFKDSNFANWG